MAPVELNYDIYDKELLAIYFLPMEALLGRSPTYCTGGNGPQQFIVLHDFETTLMMTSLLVGSFDFIIKYCPGCLGTKPDMLTCHLDIYPKGEDRAYAQANPQNFQSLFNPRQVLMAVTMDLAVIHHQIRSVLAHNPYAQEHL